MRSLAVMRMPEAPVNKDDLVPRGEHKIRFSGEVFPVQPEPVAELVNKPPYRQFRQDVLPSPRTVGSFLISSLPAPESVSVLQTNEASGHLNG